MFNKLKEKLKSWFKSSTEKIEDAEKVEAKELEEKPKKEKKSKVKEKNSAEKADRLIQEAKKNKIPETPLKFEIGKQKFEPDLDKIQEETEKIPQKILHSVKESEQEIKETQIITEDIEKKVAKAEKLIEKSKNISYDKIPLKFDVSGRSIEPDFEKIKKETETLIFEIEQAKKKDKEIKEFKSILKSAEETKEIEPEKKSFFSRLKSSFSYKISESEFNEIFDDLEFLLLENNVALEVVDRLRLNLSEKLIGKEIKRDKLEEEIKNELKDALNDIIIEPDNPLEIIRHSKKPFTILFFGTNGSGKTTSVAKIAYFLKNSGFKVVLAAADTFRAASIEQLAEHAKKLNVPLIKHDYGSDPASVGFDAIKYAKTHNYDVVLIDTAGRMHTKTNLIEEMKKIERVTKPDLKIFVAESIAGNDATEQAKTFHKSIEIDGSILSKADIDEKGGTIISISYATNKPIFYLGTGQKHENLELFNKQKFIESLGL